ncbi:glycosyl hydrolase family 28-related protein [Chryseobacterium sp. SIMBA_029]|uniref:glycosyl hydrolase family 28-related protein n=1 Tax=Chryseobacterium sp. SIMBA_029 TaxID=3085772 RepID=UPI003978436C
MTTIELNDPFTGEWTSFLETDFTYEGSAITDALCDDIIYKKVTGKYYRRILIENIVNAIWFGVTGNGTTDDTTKINEAITKSAAINGILFFPEGRYKITGSGLNLLNNSNLLGIGKSTVFEMDDNADWCISANSGNGGTTNISDNIKNITVKNIHFKSVNNQFSEFKYLMNLNAVSDVIIEGCYFTQFRGDGIYIGSSNIEGLERHNERVFVRNCHFDGVNHANRNGISIIDCNVAAIEDCTFANCSLDEPIPIGNDKVIPRMPGAIDIEPDIHAFHIVKNITIRNNTFKNVGGSPGVISIVINKITTNCGNIVIENNYISECTNANAICISTSRGATSFEELNDCMVTVQNNIFEGTPGFDNRAMTITASKNVKIFDNKFSNFDRSCIISYEEPDNIAEKSYVSDLYMERNLFQKLGLTEQVSFSCFNIKNFQFKNNELRGVSEGNTVNNFFFYFIRGVSSEIIFERNKFINSSGYTIVMAPSYNTEENTNTFTNNHFDGLYNWNFHWLRESAPLTFRNAAPPNGHIFYDETNNVSQIYLGGTWKTITMEP